MDQIQKFVWFQQLMKMLKFGYTRNKISTYRAGGPVVKVHYHLIISGFGASVDEFEKTNIIINLLRWNFNDFCWNVFISDNI